MDVLKKRLLIIIMLAVLIFAVSFYGYWQKNSVSETAASNMSPISNSTVSESNEVVIYVSGAVNNPGVFRIQSGSRILDAINNAGGLAPGADCSNINLAQVVKDSMQINVSTNMVAQPGNSNSSNKETGKININTADKNQLDKLPGIGPAMAERIIEYRKSNGPFQELTDLKKVSGIGEAKFKQMKDKISL